DVVVRPFSSVVMFSVLFDLCLSMPSSDFSSGTLDSRKITQMSTGGYVCFSSIQHGSTLCDFNYSVIDNNRSIVCLLEIVCVCVWVCVCVFVCVCVRGREREGVCV